MYLEIVSPEATLFQGEVNAVSVPGAQGSFQVLNNLEFWEANLQLKLENIFAIFSVNSIYTVN